jgi:NADP-dependent 3-hydroxy acid dehydrogenase YdfG
MLDDKSGIVIGASTGIGKAIAKALADEGVRVALAARSTSQLEDVASEIEDDGGEALVVPTDVRDSEQVMQLFETVEDDFGAIDISVNSAGVGYWKPIHEVEPQEWEHEMEVNLLGMMNATKYAAAAMLEQGSGDIVNISSITACYPNPEYPGYAASKFGVSGFTKSAHAALRDEGIRVTLIEPGKVDTPIHPDEYRDRIRMLDPENVADTVVFSLKQPDHVCVSNIQVLTNGT